MSSRQLTTRNLTEHKWYLHCLSPTALKSKFSPHQKCLYWAIAVCQHSSALSCLLVSGTWKTQDVTKWKQCLFPFWWFRKQSRKIKQICSKKKKKSNRDNQDKWRNNYTFGYVTRLKLLPFLSFLSDSSFYQIIKIDSKVTAINKSGKHFYSLKSLTDSRYSQVIPIMQLCTCKPLNLQWQISCICCNPCERSSSISQLPAIVQTINFFQYFLLNPPL